MIAMVSMPRSRPWPALAQVTIPLRASWSGTERGGHQVVHRRPGRCRPAGGLVGRRRRPAPGREPTPGPSGGSLACRLERRARPAHRCRASLCRGQEASGSPSPRRRRSSSRRPVVCTPRRSSAARDPPRSHGPGRSVISGPRLHSGRPDRGRGGGAGRCVRRPRRAGDPGGRDEPRGDHRTSGLSPGIRRSSRSARSRVSIASPTSLPGRGGSIPTGPRTSPR